MNDNIGTGIPIEYIFPDSPAERAGVRVGDILVSLNNSPISSPDDFIRAKDGLKAYPIVVSRNGEYVAMYLDCNVPAIPVGCSPIDALRIAGKLPSESPNN